MDANHAKTFQNEAKINRNITNEKYQQLETKCSRLQVELNEIKASRDAEFEDRRLRSCNDIDMDEVKMFYKKLGDICLKHSSVRLDNGIEQCDCRRCEMNRVICFTMPKRITPEVIEKAVKLLD